jgi:hypothetical protein
MFYSTRMDDEFGGFLNDGSYYDGEIDDSPLPVEDPSDTLQAGGDFDYSTIDDAEYPTTDGVVTPLELDSGSAGGESGGYDDPSAPVSDPVVPDAAVPDVAVPSSTDFSVPDAAVPDAAVPDAAVPGVAVPGVAVPDVAVPDGGADGIVPIAPTAAPAVAAQIPQTASGLPSGAEVVGTDGAGRPMIRLNEVIAPPTTMETMGGNNSSYTGSTPAVSDPLDDPTHVRLNTPVNTTHMETLGGIAPPPGVSDPLDDPTHVVVDHVIPSTTRAPSPDDPLPGSAAARGENLPNLIHGGDATQDSYTRTITGVDPQRPYPGGDITDYRAPLDGSTHSNINDARIREDNLKAGDPHP